MVSWSNVLFQLKHHIFGLIVSAIVFVALALMFGIAVVTGFAVTAIALIATMAFVAVVTHRRARLSAFLVLEILWTGFLAAVFLTALGPTMGGLLLLSGGLALLGVAISSFAAVGMGKAAGLLSIHGLRHVLRKR